MTNDTSGAHIAVDQELYPALIQCFFIIGAGYVAGQLRILTSTQSAGLARYVSNFALPAVVFKNLVDVQFQSVSWNFLASVFIAKAFVFISTAIVAAFAERPRNFASIGLYSIMASQSNDFALILPIIDAVYKQTHPDFARYIYLIAPISLVILNPIGFFLIEIQKRLDHQSGKARIVTGYRYQLIKNILYNIIRNPIVVCTLLGVIFNRIFNEHLPDILERILTPIAQSFSSTALFYLGLTMVGRLRRLHAHLVITVFAISTIKLIVFPLVLRQAVFYVMKSTNSTYNSTLDYSNFGFLYGTAPIAPSVVFYVPETYQALQSVASTGLVVSTLLAGPIMLISAKMINLKTLDIKVSAAYETALAKTGYDVSMISLLCTLIVLLSFVLRRHLLKVSYILKYTFILVCLQMVHAIWTIAAQYVTLPISTKATTIVSLGSILTALVTRAWVTSISIILMITVCYSDERARCYFWLYHLFGWLLPICTTLIIYLRSPNDDSQQPVTSVQKYGLTQIIASICLLALCIVTSTVNLLRVIRRVYKLKTDEKDDNIVNYTESEIQNLINDSSSNELSQSVLNSNSTDIKPYEIDAQLYRHAILVGLLNINAFVCIAVLLWSILSKNRDGVYYEVQFLDSVLLHGQGIISFLVFALDADLLLPIRRKVIQLLKRFRLIKTSDQIHTDPKVIESVRAINFKTEIRPNFIRELISTQSSTNSIETTFDENVFCQWLVRNGFMQNISDAQNYCQNLIIRKEMICIDRKNDQQILDSVNHWYAFTK